jgi:hypothetical protein
MTAASGTWHHIAEDPQARSTVRVALSPALIERGYLRVRSRRVTPPITLQTEGRIS